MRTGMFNQGINLLSKNNFAFISTDLPLKRQARPNYPSKMFPTVWQSQGIRFHFSFTWSQVHGCIKWGFFIGIFGDLNCTFPLCSFLHLMHGNLQAWEILRGRGSDWISAGLQIEMHCLIQSKQIIGVHERSTEDDGDGCVWGLLVSFPQRFIAGCSEHPRVLPFLLLVV